jgi:predicted PurR-regulated permease PerM
MIRDRLFRTTLVLVGFAALLYILDSFSTLLTIYGGLIMIFVMGWLLAFIINPFCHWVAAPHIPRRGVTAAPKQRLPWGAAVLIVYLAVVVIVVGAVIIVVPILIQQLATVLATMPTTWANLSANIAALQASLGIKIPSEMQNTAGTGLSLNFSRLISSSINGLSALVAGTASFFTNAILVLVFALYLNLGGAELTNRVLGIAPTRFDEEARVFADTVNRVFGGFLRGQVTYAAISAVIVAIVMIILHVPLVGLASLSTFLLSLIPLLGSFLGILPPVLAALTVSGKTALLMLVILGGVQLVLTNAIMPKIFGSSIHLEPVVVFIAIVVGINIAGIWGAIFAIPLAALIISMVQFFRDRRFLDASLDSPPGVE